MHVLTSLMPEPITNPGERAHGLLRVVDRPRRSELGTGGVDNHVWIAPAHETRDSDVFIGKVFSFHNLRPVSDTETIAVRNQSKGSNGCALKRDWRSPQPSRCPRQCLGETGRTG